jgi:hypothetical protein
MRAGFHGVMTSVTPSEKGPNGLIKNAKLNEEQLG